MAAPRRARAASVGGRGTELQRPALARGGGGRLGGLQRPPGARRREAGPCAGAGGSGEETLAHGPDKPREEREEVHGFLEEDAAGAGGVAHRGGVLVAPFVLLGVGGGGADPSGERGPPPPVDRGVAPVVAHHEEGP